MEGAKTRIMTIYGEQTVITLWTPLLAQKADGQKLLLSLDYSVTRE